MTRPRLFVEPCAGTAAVTLRLIGGYYANPPTAYMGGKRNLATEILLIMGLHPGQGADAVLLGDAGPWGQIWSVLSDPSKCDEVARILRSWADEDPRELWDRLRDEHKGTWSAWSERRAAGWLVIQSRTIAGVPAWYENGEVVIPEPRPNGKTKPAVQRAQYNRTDGGSGIHASTIANRVESIAAYLFSGHFSYRAGIPESGFCPIHTKIRIPTDTSNGANPRTPQTVANRLMCLPEIGELSVFAGPAEDLSPPADCAGVYIYLDPPYEGCTRYAADMPREVVLDVARRWSDAGAVVCVSEAVPLPLDGWHHVDITSTRKGQKRTFSKQKLEWLTINRPPAWRPAIQQGLFEEATP